MADFRVRQQVDIVGMARLIAQKKEREQAMQLRAQQEKRAKNQQLMNIIQNAASITSTMVSSSRQRQDTVERNKLANMMASADERVATGEAGVATVSGQQVPTMQTQRKADSPEFQAQMRAQATRAKIGDAKLAESLYADPIKQDASFTTPEQLKAAGLGEYSVAIPTTLANKLVALKTQKAATPAVSGLNKLVGSFDKRVKVIEDRYTDLLFDPAEHLDPETGLPTKATQQDVLRLATLYRNRAKVEVKLAKLQGITLTKQDLQAQLKAIIPPELLGLLPPKEKRSLLNRITLGVLDKPKKKAVIDPNAIKITEL